MGQSVSGVSEPLTLRYETIYADKDSHVRPSFVEIGKAELTRTMCGIHHEK